MLRSQGLALISASLPSKSVVWNRVTRTRAALSTSGRARK